MGRHLLFILTLLITASSSAQQKATPGSTKTIPGIGTGRLLPWTKGVYADGRLAVYREDNSLLTLDVAKGAIRKLPVKYMELSPDVQHSVYINGFHDVRMPNGNWEKKSTTVIHHLGGSAVDTLTSDYFPFGMDAQGRIIAAKTILSESKNEVFCLVGLYAIDWRSGQPVATLRTDTIYKPGRFGLGSYGSSWGGGAPEMWSLRPSFLVIKAGKQRLQVFPFNSEEIVTIHYEETGDERFEPQLIDDANVYMHSTVFRHGKDLTAYSIRTGKLAAKHQFPNAANYQMLYAVGSKGLYRYDKAAAMVYAEVVRDGAFVATDSFKISGFALPTSQDWEMLACKGPSLLFTPLNIDKAEAGGEAANTASLIALPSGKVTLRITPFYNRSAAAIAQAAVDGKAAFEKQRAWAAAQEKTAVEEKAARCKAAWGNSEFNQGITRKWGEFYVILKSYDCEKDEYSFWIPKQAFGSNTFDTEGKFATDNGHNFRLSGHKTREQYHTCTECDGDGSYEVTTYTTRTKDLPWGYFSGIETRSIHTTATTRQQFCNACHGRGVVLK